MQGVVKKPNKRVPRPPIGWPLLPVPVEGTLRYPTLEESIKQNIKVLLLTRPGERLMRPRFGAGLDRFVHEPNTLATRQGIHDSVVTALTRWEARIVLDRVEVWEEDDLDAVRIEIAYRVRRTGAQASTTVRLELGG